MKEAKQRVQINRCFENKCPEKSDKEKEQQIKDVLLTASQRRRANREISHLLKTFHGTRKLRELLRAMKQRGYPDYVLAVAIERVEAERKRDELTFEEIMDFEEFKASLDQQK